MDPTVSQNLYFCSLSEKAGVTFLFMRWIVEQELFKARNVTAQSRCDVEIMLSWIWRSVKKTWFELNPKPELCIFPESNKTLFVFTVSKKTLCLFPKSHWNNVHVPKIVLFLNSTRNVCALNLMRHCVKIPYIHSSHPMCALYSLLLYHLKVCKTHKHTSSARHLQWASLFCCLVTHCLCSAVSQLICS